MARRTYWRWIISAAGLLIGLSGCEQTSPPPAPPVRVAPAVKPPVTNDPPPVVEQAEADSPPVVAVKTLLAEIDAGRLDAFAEFLPEAYRSELEALWKILAAKIPADLQARLHSVASKSVELVERKFDLIAKASGSPPLDDERRERLAAALSRLSVSDGQAWQAADLKTLLQGPATDVFAVWQTVSSAGSAMSVETDVRLVKLDGDKAVLSFQSPLDAEPREVDFVHLDGHWIPKSLADGWKSAVAPWRKQVEQLSEAEFAAAAARLSPHLGQIEGTLDQMLKAEAADELQLGWWQIQSILLQARQELLQPGPSPKVELRLAGQISEKDLSQLLEQLVEASDQPDLAEYVTFPATAGLTIHLSPVNDVEAFVTRLTFVKVVKTDERQVEIEIQPQK